MHAKPHDGLFRNAFETPHNVEGLLRSLLPNALIKQMDFRTLRLCSGASVDPFLDDLQSDLLFEVRISGQLTLIYILIEHQSSVDSMMAYRVSCYVHRVWARWRRENPKATTLPLVLPIVVSNGRAAWGASTCLSQLIDISPEIREALGDHVPSLRFVLDDLSTVSDTDLRARPIPAFGRLALLLLKNLRGAADTIATLMREAPLIRKIVAAHDGSRASLRIRTELS